jgi:hypothetical protein
MAHLRKEGEGCNGETKYMWTIVQHGIDIDLPSLLKETKATQQISKSTIAKLRERSRKIRMSARFWKLWTLALDLALGKPASPEVMSSVLEMAAGIEYARTASNIGMMSRLRAAYARTSKPLLLQPLRKYVRLSLQQKKFLERDAWFDLRARVMDAFALCVALGSTTRVVIYYAGSSHTDSLRDFMVHSLGALEVPTTHEVFGEADVGTLTRTEQLEWNGRVFILLGESHNVTSMSFALTLLQYLRGKCSLREQTTFMLERHIENKRDATQQQLMCNIPNFALHRTRCDALMTQNADRCPGLVVVPVDNRHIDCGFLRHEILDAWRVDDAFRAEAQMFQRRAYRSVLYFIDNITGGQLKTKKN